MDICRQIKERYPTQLYLPYVDAVKTVSIQWDGSLPQDLRRQIRQDLDLIPLPVQTEGGDLKVRICMAPCPGEDSCLCLQWEERSYFFAKDDQRSALIWTLYALVTDQAWFKKLSRAKICAITYSANQQGLASALLSTVDYWQSTLSEGVLTALIRDAVKHASQKLAAAIPNFSARPVTELGMTFIRSTGGLFYRKQQIRLSELAEKLYGQYDFSEDIDAYCRFLLKRDDFNDAINEAFTAVSQSLYRLPLMEFSVRLRDAIEELRAAESDDYVRRAASAMEKSAYIRRLDYKQLGQIFAEADEQYRAMAEFRVRALVLNTLAARLQSFFNDVLPRTLRSIQEWNRSLRPFCKVGPIRDRLGIGWDQCGDISSDALRINDSSWDSQMLYALQTNTNIVDGYYLQTWFCSTRTFGEPFVQNGMFANSMTPVPGMAEQLMVGYMAESLQE